MDNKKKKIVIFEIGNTQNDYANCLEMINVLEKSEETIGASETHIKSLFDNLRIKVGTMSDKPSPKYMEQPLESTQYARETHTGRAIKQLHNMTISNYKSYQGEKASYHIRVHMNSDSRNKDSIEKELVHFQYLALLLIRLEYLFLDKSVPKKRISVFIVPCTGDKYPFKSEEGDVDFATYEVVSQYLRLLAKKYTG